MAHRTYRTRARLGVGGNHYEIGDEFVLDEIQGRALGGQLEDLGLAETPPVPAEPPEPDPPAAADGGADAKAAALVDERTRDATTIPGKRDRMDRGRGKR